MKEEMIFGWEDRMIKERIRKAEDFSEEEKMELMG